MDKYDIKYITEKKVSSIGSESNTKINNKDIKLVVNENSDLEDLLSDGYLPVVIKNNSDGIYRYDEKFIIEYKKDDTFTNFPPNLYFFHYTTFYVFKQQKGALSAPVIP